MTPDALRTCIDENLHRVRTEIAAACRRSGRASGSVTLVAVTKYAQIEWVEALVERGVLDLAESRPQQFAERVAQIAAPARWHFIGHLQRNKARKVLTLAERIHSVDSFRLLATLEALALELVLTPRVLLEVNVSGEESKDGFRPEELLAQPETLAACRSLRIEGLMTMAPLTDEPELARPTFRGLRELRDRMNAELRPRGGHDLVDLSMGMSGDFSTAIEEGATLVRIGSGLFEGCESVTKS